MIEETRQQEQRKAKENEAQIIYKLHELGDQKLVKEYMDQRSKIYKARDKMLYGI